MLFTSVNIYYLPISVKFPIIIFNSVLTREVAEVVLLQLGWHYCIIINNANFATLIQKGKKLKI